MPPKAVAVKRNPSLKGLEKTSEKRQKTEGKENGINSDQKCFVDETASMSASAVENYFLQGKTATELSNHARVRRGKRAVNKEEADDDDDQDSGLQNLISDFTKCDLPGLRNYICQTQDSSDFINKLERFESEEFPKWKLYLAAGFNILLHGVGSKRELLSSFEKELSEYTYMRVEARKEGTSPKALLSAINEHTRLNCHIKRGQTTLDWAREIRQNLKKSDQQIILLIDNLEAPDWSCRSEQETLCELLADQKVVKLVGTVDHVYSTFIWNSRQLSALSFIHVTHNTFEIPLQEMLTGDSRLLGLDARSTQSSHTLSSLDVFWKSLANNSQKLFRLFFQMHFDSKKPVKFWDLFNAAKDDFIASTDAALRTQLVEFKDHRVLKWTRGDDGNDQLSGMVELKLVTEFLDSKGLPLLEEKDE